MLRHRSAVIISKFKFSTRAWLLRARATRCDPLIAPFRIDGPGPATTFYAKFKIAEQQLL
jgi:hypothetical protein